VVAVSEDVILDCYRLAKWYSVNPETFLSMPLSDVRRHMDRTIQLAKIMKREAEVSDDG